MITVAQALARATELPGDTARLDLELLLCHVLQKSRSWLYTWPEAPLRAEQAQVLNGLLQRRAAGEPIAHLIGQRDFWTLSLKVDASTLIPRPDTECLVEWALSLPLPEDARVLDLGTGTGAIALALASEKPHWQITATDIEPAALALADRNRQTLGLPVTLVASDWFSALAGQCFHLIVSNPPYIDPADPHLQQGDVRFEPRSALVADQQGMADIRHLCREAPRFLFPGGWLGIEHGYDQAGQVSQCFQARGFRGVASQRDLAGHERFTVGQMEQLSA